MLPLAFDMTPPDQRKPLFERLAGKIMRETDGHIGTGLIGGQWLMRVLSDNGRADLAYRLATQSTYPSWGYMIGKNATTIWELWNGDTADPAMNSHNHVMLVGDLCIWMHEYLAGIRADIAEPAFKHVIMRPYAVAGLDAAEGVHESMYGTIRSAWKLEAGKFAWQITLPGNTWATIYVPAADVVKVSENGKPAAKTPGVKFLRMENGAAVFEIGAGQYSFVSTN